MALSHELSLDAENAGFRSGRSCDFLCLFLRQRLPELRAVAQLAGVAASSRGDSGRMDELLNLCRQGTVITRMLTHDGLFFSLQTPLWQPDLQDPRGSFLWPLQPEDSVSNLLFSAEQSLSLPLPSSWHWP